MTLVKVVEGLKIKDVSVWEKVYRIYYKKIVKFLIKKLGTYSDEAEDLAHNIFMDLPETIKTFKIDRARSGDPLLSWLYRIASNKAVDFISRRKKLLPLEKTVVCRYDIHDINEAENCLDKHKLEMVKRIINERLSKKDRGRWLILTRQYLSNDEKAELIGVKVDSLRQIRKRIRAKILIEIGKEGIEI